MGDQISADNTKKVLLEGHGNVKRTNANPSGQRKGAADVIVENATEKRYLWTARAFAIVFAVSLCCNIILTYAITATMPLYRVEPYLFIFSNKEEQIYKITPAKKIKEYKYLTEMFVREYVILRNTFLTDTDEMDLRWGKNGKIFEMSIPEPECEGYRRRNKEKKIKCATYSNFRKEHADKAMELIRKYNLERKVSIISVNDTGGGWWNVDFKTTDMMPSYGAPRIGLWNAHLYVGYRGKTARFNDRLKNPLGFTVLQYQMEKSDKN